jgi:hypothetical protein
MEPPAPRARTVHLDLKLSLTLVRSIAFAVHVDITRTADGSHVPQFTPEERQQLLDISHQIAHPSPTAVSLSSKRGPEPTLF